LPHPQLLPLAFSAVMSEGVLPPSRLVLFSTLKTQSSFEHQTFDGSTVWGTYDDARLIV
jgi:hypothetical protein